MTIRRASNRLGNGSKRAFTLIELLVVILILAILAAMIIPRYFSRVDEAKRARALDDIASLSKLLQVFRMDTGRYPTSEEGLQALRTRPADVNNWGGPYSTNPIPSDPWGNEYIYEYPGSSGEDSFLLMSLGQDGAPGGDGANADIVVGAED
jgi:general secretion pathway protein G